MQLQPMYATNSIKRHSANSTHDQASASTVSWSFKRENVKAAHQPKFRLKIQNDPMELLVQMASSASQNTGTFLSGSLRLRYVEKRGRPSVSIKMDLDSKGREGACLAVSLFHHGKRGKPIFGTIFNGFFISPFHKDQFFHQRCSCMATQC